jgi:NTP pyrophosphatase (non-canonical NTP hydrolase)
MTLDEFQFHASMQRLDRDQATLEYGALRLCEEAGEVAGVVKRLTQINYTGKKRAEDLLDEMGDVLHSLAKLANIAGFDLERVAQASLEKQDRKSS